MNLPKLTRKQQAILKLLYSYRFLNRIQIQALMHHKDYKTINVWLKDLLEKEYVERIYSTDFAERTKPAVYYLGINGIRFLKTLADPEIGYVKYQAVELHKRYRESLRSQSYIDHCYAIAECCVVLDKKTIELEATTNGVGGNKSVTYFYETEADYLEDSYYHFISESELIRPHLCFSKDIFEGIGDPYAAESYLLEMFDANLPRYRIKKRISNYIEYLEEGGWEDETEGSNPPIVLLICPRTTDLIYTKRRARGLLVETYDRGDVDRPHIWITTIDKLLEHGVLGDIWEKA